MFITLEGIDGAGKSTQAKCLAEQVKRAGKDVLLTCEPGGWDGGEKIRSILLESTLKHPMTELLLFFADRCEHVNQVIRPALDCGKTVICERYTDSTVAYQYWGRNLDLQIINSLSSACNFPVPDLTLYFRLSAEQARKRCQQRGTLDRIEASSDEFRRRVILGLEYLAEQNPVRIHKIDASKNIDEVTVQMIAEVRKTGIL